jgi:hypothetical protein
MACVAPVNVLTESGVRRYCDCGRDANGYADRVHGWCKRCLRGCTDHTSHISYMRRENLSAIQRE